MSDDEIEDQSAPPPAARVKKAKPTGGPLGRAQALADGLAFRLGSREGAQIRSEDGRTLFELHGRLAARWTPKAGWLDVELDPRSGAGDERAMRRVGVPHPDRERSKAGWRLIRVRTSRDASRVISVLKAPREKATGDLRAARRLVMRTELLVGSVHVRRLEDPPRPDDGARVFVDLTWPRGVDRDKVALTLWMPEIAPGPKVREVFGIAPARTRGFRKAYLQELKGSSKAHYVSQLRHLAQKGPLTLLTALRDVSVSHAAILVQAVSKGRTPRG